MSKYINHCLFIFRRLLYNIDQPRHRNLKVRELFDVCEMPDFYWEQREIKLSPNSVQNESLEQVLLRLKNPSARRDCKSRVKALKQKTDRNNPM